MRGRVPVVPRFQSQHDEPTDSRLLSGSRLFSKDVVCDKRNASRTASSGSRCEVVYQSCVSFSPCRSPDVILSRHLNGEISRVDGERTRSEGKQSQHDEPTDSRLLSGSRCVVSRTVVFSILYRSITPDVILSPSFYGRDLEGRR
jgi:hypothetical protein